MLIKTQQMLAEMNHQSHMSSRPVFSFAALTANKKEWQRKQGLINQASKLRDGKKKSSLLKEADSINAGGTLIIHGKAVLMNARGIHRARQIKAEGNKGKTQFHYDNRTRNLQLLPNDIPVKTHFDLITHFNNNRVIH